MLASVINRSTCKNLQALFKLYSKLHNKLNLIAQDWLLNAGEYIKIPKISVHCVKNTSSKNMVIIEIQLGEILKESDIEPFLEKIELRDFLIFKLKAP